MENETLAMAPSGTVVLYMNNRTFIVPNGKGRRLPIPSSLRKVSDSERRSRDATTNKKTVRCLVLEAGGSDEDLAGLSDIASAFGVALSKTGGLYH
jgi:hypothetical protein